MTTRRVDMIRDRLNEVFSPVSLNIIDDSAMHAGHAQAGGAGHFTVEIISDAFQDKNLIQRHRMVYDALSGAMNTEIHALSIKASTPAEAGS